MKTSKEFDNVLDECLERLLIKGETMEQCLQSYPEQAAELEPLLQTATATKQALAIQPRPDFRAEARYQFYSSLQEIVSQKSRPFFGWVPRWATVVTLALGLILVGSGTVAAAGYSMPDSPLYPVKLATEQVQLALTPSDLGKAQLHANLADKRVREIIYMANKGNSQQIEAITRRLDRRLAILATLAPVAKVRGVPRVLAPLPAQEAAPEEAASERDASTRANDRAKLRMTIAHYAVKHPADLRAVLKKAPESARPALRRAITVSEAGYGRTLKALD